MIGAQERVVGKSASSKTCDAVRADIAPLMAKGFFGPRPHPDRPPRQRTTDPRGSRVGRIGNRREIENSRGLVPYSNGSSHASPETGLPPASDAAGGRT